MLHVFVWMFVSWYSRNKLCSFSTIPEAPLFAPSFIARRFRCLVFAHPQYRWFFRTFSQFSFPKSLFKTRNLQLIYLQEMSGVNMRNPERRIENNPFDVDAWNLLLREHQVKRPLKVWYARYNFSLGRSIKNVNSTRVSWISFQILEDIGERTSSTNSDRKTLKTRRIYSQDVWSMCWISICGNAI